MHPTHAQLKALTALLVLILAVTVFERGQHIVAAGEPEAYMANILNPVASFLGIQQEEEPQQQQYSSLQPTETNEETRRSSFTTTPSPSSLVTLDGAAATSASQSVTLAGRTPTLLCLPGLKERDEPVLIMWACRDEATSTTGENFDTDGATFGKTTVRPEGDTTYTLTCENDDEEVAKTSASCGIEVAQPSLAILPTPQSVRPGRTGSLSWSSVDTSSCVVTSNQHPSFQRSGTKGDIVTPPIVRDTIFTLTCESVTGAVVSDTTIVPVRR